MYAIRSYYDMPMNKEITKEMVNKFWDLKDVENRYRDFITIFRRIYSLKTPIEEFTPRQCFIISVITSYSIHYTKLYDLQQLMK